MKYLLDKLFRRKDDYFDAIVLLITFPRLVEDEYLQRLLPQTTTPAEVITVDTGLISVRSGEYVFEVLSAPGPYGPMGAGAEWLAERCVDLRLKDAIRRHQAFISINCNHETPGRIRPSTQIAMAKVAGALIDETVVAIMDAGKNRLIAPSLEVQDLLLAGERDEAFGEWKDAVVGVRPATLDAQVAEARARYPELLAAFVRRMPDSHFTIKLAFRDPEKDYVEHMWVNPTELTETHITGELQNQPHRLRSVKKGQTVTLPVTELSDWVYLENGARVGSFTEAAVRGQ